MLFKPLFAAAKYSVNNPLSWKIFMHLRNPICINLFLYFYGLCWYCSSNGKSHFCSAGDRPIEDPITGLVSWEQWLFTLHFLLCSNGLLAATLFIKLVDKIQIKKLLYGYKENAIRLSHMSEQTTEWNKCFMGLACFAYILKSRFEARSSWLLQLDYFLSGLCPLS